MNKVTKFFIKFLLIVVVGAVAGYILTALLENHGFSGGFDSKNLFSTTTIITVIVCIAGYGIYALNKLGKSDGGSGSSSSRFGKTSSGESKEAYFSARLITKEELRKNKDFHFCYFNDLPKIKFDGIPLRAERVGNKTEINMQKPIHTLVIGTTGSGKTTMLVDPTIQILGNTGNHPSMVISDPKGELYAHECQKLRNWGYDVQCINLRQPSESSRVNPIEPAFLSFQRAHNLVKEVKVFKGPLDKKFTKVAGATYGEEWYVFEDVAYPDKQSLKRQLLTKKQELINSANEDIQDIALTLSPTTGNDPIWSSGARDFIRAIMMAMLEDSLNPELGMTKEKFNLYNVSKIAGYRDVGDDSMRTLKDYFAGRDEMSECVKLANTVIATAKATAQGIMTHVSQAMNLFDQGIGALTSATDLDFSQFSDRPTALFIIIPDETNTRNALANIYITQLYKALIAKANENKKEITLPRHVYFLLDEFGNLPKIEKMKNFITAGRSRGIFLMLVVQDYTQLYSVYGEQDAATIKNNCNIHIYIGTKDQKTREEFSKNIGEVTLEMKNTSSSKSKSPSQDGKSSSSTNTSTSTNLVNVPLISANELDHLKHDEVVINSYGFYSIRSTFVRTYENPDYKFVDMPVEHIIPTPFDEAGLYYDIKKRNSIVLKDDDDDDDDDFDFDFSKFKRN